MSNAIEILDSKPVPHADYATPARSPSSMAFATWATDIVQTFFSSDAYARTKGVLEFSLCLAAMLRLRIYPNDNANKTTHAIREILLRAMRIFLPSTRCNDKLDGAKFAKILIGIISIFPIQNYYFLYKRYSRIYRRVL